MDTVLVLIAAAVIAIVHGDKVRGCQADVGAAVGAVNVGECGKPASPRSTSSRPIAWLL